MAVSPTILTISRVAQIQAERAAAGNARVGRRISPQSGRALEILGHAIDYLTDEYIHRGGQFRAGDPELEATQLLKSANRAVYYACPVVPTFGERCLQLLGIGRR
jgi:hypothetical protein